jgi:hypothetical protein
VGGRAGRPERYPDRRLCGRNHIESRAKVAVISLNHADTPRTAVVTCGIPVASTGTSGESAAPGFQFMQDRLKYNSRSHHSNMDVYDRLQGEDMVQVATVLAVVAYSAATDPHDFPRKALLPERPTSSGR